jgi:hypothetical protein
VGSVFHQSWCLGCFPLGFTRKNFRNRI